MGVNLLLAIDQFEPGRAAVGFTIGFATRLGADVQVFHVREVPSSLGIEPMESQAESHDLVEGAVRQLQAAGLRAEGRFCSDHASCVPRLIAEEASERQCSAIVLGSLRMRGFQAVMGQRTRERVLTMSTLPVIVSPPASRVHEPIAADP